jgi:uncharacterized secreted protein with C-terminal beta-propeller domain
MNEGKGFFRHHTEHVENALNSRRAKSNEVITTKRRKHKFTPEEERIREKQFLKEIEQDNIDEENWHKINKIAKKCSKELRKIKMDGKGTIRYSGEREVSFIQRLYYCLNR